MITLTDQAIQKVKALIEQQGLADVSLRVYVQGGGCSGYQYGMAFDDTADETDTSFDFSGLTVLVDAMSLPFLETAIVDYQDTAEGVGFCISNLNIPSGCDCCSSHGHGCGEEEPAGESADVEDATDCCEGGCDCSH